MFLHAFLAHGLLEEIGAPKRSDEHEVAGDQPKWFRATGLIDDLVHHVLRCMPGGMDCSESKTAEFKRISIPEEGVCMLVHPG